MPNNPRNEVNSNRPSADDYLPGISLVIPAYNEEMAIGDIVRRAMVTLAQCVSNWEVIVVSDCSTDKTSEVAAIAGAVVLEHPMNKGYGTSLKTGIVNAMYDTIAIIDADGSYSPEDLLLLVPLSARFDMVVGQRIGKHYYGGPFKYLGRRLQLFLVEFATGAKVPDVNSGLRVFPRDVSLRYFDTLCDGFSFTTSITLSMMLGGYTISFIPVSYAARIGKSHIHYFRDTVRSLQIIALAILKYNPMKLFLLLGLVTLVIIGISGVFALVAVLSKATQLSMLLGIVSILCALSALILIGAGLLASLIVVKLRNNPSSPMRYN